jgi:hypothetical protein
VRTKTAELWAEQDAHRGDRHRLFSAVARSVDAATVLYPGSWCDVAASFVWPSVTYVDLDRRAGRFFDDVDGVRQIIAGQDGSPAEPQLRFLHADYTEPLPVELESFDLLVSLYAGPVSRHCTEYLRVGGTLLANPSHGDVALASIDSRYELVGVVRSTSADHRVSIDDLASYLVPKRSVEVTVDLIERTHRGVAYTRSPFAYLFRRVS